MKKRVKKKKKIVKERSGLKNHGFIFLCDKKAFKEVLKEGVFYTDKLQAPRLFSCRKGDSVFFYDAKNDELFGVFLVVKEADYDSSLGDYPYYFHVRPKGEIKSFCEASKLFDKLSITYKDTLKEEGVNCLEKILEAGMMMEVKKGDFIEANYRPPIFATNLWDYPTQSYGDTKKGDNKFRGVTPAFVIYNLVWRYTEPYDLVCDPMAGSGTTIDVCREEKRNVVAFDIVSLRPDIIEADARNIPLEDEICDLVFIDSPYGDNIDYNDSPLNIGKISCFNDVFYDELEEVAKESFRILKKGKVLAWLISDYWERGVFIPVSLKLYERLVKYFIPVDIVCVVRRNQTSHTGVWHYRALKNNFYLRGFKTLFIMRKGE